MGLGAMILTWLEMSKNVRFWNVILFIRLIPLTCHPKFGNSTYWLCRYWIDTRLSLLQLPFIASGYWFWNNFLLNGLIQLTCHQYFGELTYYLCWYWIDTRLSLLQFPFIASGYWFWNNFLFTGLIPMDLSPIFWRIKILLILMLN